MKKLEKEKRKKIKRYKKEKNTRGNNKKKRVSKGSRTFPKPEYELVGRPIYAAGEPGGTRLVAHE